MQNTIDIPPSTSRDRPHWPGVGMPSRYALGVPDDTISHREGPKEPPRSPRRILLPVLLAVPFILGGGVAYWAAEHVATPTAAETAATPSARLDPAELLSLEPTPSGGVDLNEPPVVAGNAPVPSATVFRFEHPDGAAPMSPRLAEPAVPPPPQSESPGNAATPMAEETASGSAPAAKDDLLELGDAFLAAGDIEWARRYYESAIAEGNAQAALAMGWTYDPLYRQRSNRRHLDPDAARAMAWYQQALDMGAGRLARERLDDLSQWTARDGRAGDTARQPPAADRPLPVPE